MDIISKDKKEIQWRGLPRTSLSDIEELKVFKPNVLCLLAYVPKLFLKLSFDLCRLKDSHLGTESKRKQHTPKSWKNK